MREFVMAVRREGRSNELVFQQMRAQRTYPSLVSECRWAIIEQDLGHFRPCRRTGNASAMVLRDHDLIFLALYRMIFPKATIPQCNAFLYRANFGNPSFRFYSASQISEAETRIGLTKKRGSTTAYQALLPINVFKRNCFFNLRYPFGIADINRSDMVDLDECGVFVETADRKIGKSYIGVRVKQGGPYSKSDKWTLLMAIAGDPNGQRWRKQWLEGGTTNDKMIEFIQEILDSIGPGTPERRRCFMMDNLTSHHNLQISAMIHAAGHRLAFRAPYYPIDGPIEYVFNTLQGYLRINMHNIRDGPTLINELGNAITSIQSFEAYFINCGFWRN
jgi:transposase